MRESFGGAFMIKLALVFIIIYVSFMAVAINYAKAFRVKNQIINILEQRQYVKGDQRTHEAIDKYLAGVPYNIGNAGKNDCKGNSEYLMRGVCIESHGDSDHAYFTVTTYIAIKDFPFFKIELTLPVRGETKTIIY